MHEHGWISKMPEWRKHVTDVSPHSFARAGKLGAKAGWEICVLIDNHRNRATFILYMRVEGEGTVIALKKQEAKTTRSNHQLPLVQQQRGESSWRPELRWCSCQPDRLFQVKAEGRLDPYHWKNTNQSGSGFTCVFILKGSKKEPSKTSVSVQWDEMNLGQEKSHGPSWVWSTVPAHVLM